MSNTVVIGPKGSGKTLFITWCALRDPRPVYANYKILVDRWRNLTPSVLERIHEPSFVGLDEAYTWADARIGGSLANRFLSYISFQGRKRGIDMMESVQLMRSLDVREREIADLYVECKALNRGADGFGYKVIKPETDKVIARFRITPELARNIWAYYDTWEEISTIDRYMLAGLETDPDEMNRIIDEAVAAVVAESGGRKLTLPIIRDHCRNVGIPPKFAQGIYDRIVAGG